MSLLDSIQQKVGQMFDKENLADPASASEPAFKEDEQKNPYENHELIRSQIKEFLDTTDKLRWAFERLWFRSILYYLGNQWLTFDARSRRWREKKLRKWVPRPVTNRFASTCDTIVATIEQTKVEPSAWPATDDVEDIASANVADRLMSVIDDEIQVAKIRRSIASWMVLNGDCFVLPQYDKRDMSLGTVNIQSQRCEACMAVAQPDEFENGCPSCGQAVGTQPAVDEMGSPVNKEYPKGRLRATAYSPLQVYLNIDIHDLKKQQKFLIMETFSLDTIKTKWPEEGPKVKPDAQAATRTGKYFMEALAYTTEDSGYNLTGASNRDRATVMKYFEMPTENFPEGLLCHMSSDEVVLEVEPSPFFDLDPETGSKSFYNPLIQFPYNEVPGRLYSKTPAYDLLYKQDQLNRLESLIELMVMRGAYGIWFLPAGSSISNVSGEAGLMVRYTPHGTSGVKPEIVTNNPVPPSLFQWKEQIQADFEEIGGTFDALKGNVPKGVSAGYAIQMLTDRSYGRFTPVLGAWEASWVELYTTLLKLARTYFTEERISRIKGDSGKWEIGKFDRASLKGKVDIKVEGGQARPRNKLSEQAILEMLIKYGVVNPQDPEQKYEICQLVGMSHILGSQDEDVRAACKEWDDFLQWDGIPLDPESGQPAGPTVRLVVDNHVTHISDHRKRAKTDDFVEQPKEKQLAWEQHIMDHMNALMMLQGMTQPMMPQKPGAGGDKESKIGKKGSENGDQTMNQVRQGGSSTLGSGGDNQSATAPTA